MNKSKGTFVSTIVSLLADGMAIRMVNHKTAGARLILVPEKDVEEKAVFGRLNRSSAFVQFGGEIPAPIA
jgi:uncharacterized protein (UPF0210 family)